MSAPNAYIEDQLVEQPAIGMFTALGCGRQPRRWKRLLALEETLGEGGTLGRETKGEVVLVDRLRAALTKLTPACPPKPSSPLSMNLLSIARQI
jgi:type I restriction enzyme R subunit